jgi:hypothetical protein
MPAFFLGKIGKYGHKLLLRGRPPNETPNLMKHRVLEIIAFTLLLAKSTPTNADIL